MKRTWVFVFPLLFAARAGWGQSSATLKGIDVYGTGRVADADVERKFGDHIREYFRAKNAESRSKSAAVTSQELKNQIEEFIRRTWKLGWVRLSWMEYFKSDEHTVYITVDTVEPGDLKTRMPFRAAPRKSFSDPAGLLDAWTQYSEAGWALVRRGDLSPDRAACPAFYCTWGSQTPELKALEEKLIRKVPENQEVLARILAEDRDAAHRACAAYLLAYLRNGNEVSHFLQTALLDPDLEVRAAAMRVYSDMAVYHKDIFLPIEMIGAALDYPTVEDRNKALAVMVGLADQPAYRAYLLGQASPTLLKLLRLKQPANHDLAYAVLGMLSKENFSGTNYEAWEAWIGKARAEAAPSGSPQSTPKK